MGPPSPQTLFLLAQKSPKLFKEGSKHSDNHHHHSHGLHSRVVAPLRQKVRTQEGAQLHTTNTTPIHTTPNATTPRLAKAEHRHQKPYAAQRRKRRALEPGALARRRTPSTAARHLRRAHSLAHRKGRRALWPADHRLLLVARRALARDRCRPRARPLVAAASIRVASSAGSLR